MIGEDVYTCCRCEVAEPAVEILECACSDTFCVMCLEAHQRLCTPHIRGRGDAVQLKDYALHAEAQQ